MYIAHREPKNNSNFAVDIRLQPASLYSTLMARGKGRGTCAALAGFVIPCSIQSTISQSHISQQANNQRRLLAQDNIGGQRQSKSSRRKGIYTPAEGQLQGAGRSPGANRSPDRMNISAKRQPESQFDAAAVVPLLRCSTWSLVVAQRDYSMPCSMRLAAHHRQTLQAIH